MQVKWTEPAQRDLRALVAYVLDFNPAAARRLKARIEDAVALLGDHPAIGRSGRVPATREWVVQRTPYIIAYRVVEDRLEILRIIHGKRRWPTGALAP